MNLQDLLQNEPNTILAIKAEQMQEIIDYAIAKTKSEFEEKQKPEQYLTPKITAQKLDVTLCTLWRWDRDNYLKPVPIGGKRRYKLSDIERILKGRS